MLLENAQLQIAFQPIQKVASRAISRTITGFYVEQTEFPVIAFIRHPWRRLESALDSALGGCDTAKNRLERAIEADDPHVRPQVRFLDRPLHFLGCLERIDEDWKVLQAQFALPDLIRHGARALKNESDINWNDYLSLYRADLCLWQSLQR